MHIVQRCAWRVRRLVDLPPIALQALDQARQFNQTTNTPGAPLHDVHSNGADAFRYLGLVAEMMTNEEWGGALNYPRLTTA